MRFNQDKIDELMRLLKQAKELFAGNFDSEGDFDADQEDERAMLETTRAYALDRLTVEGERDSTARRHAEYFRDLLRRNNATWGTLPMQGWWR